MALDPCELYRLPPNPTEFDLEVGYAWRGLQLVACDGKRQLLVDSIAAEDQLQAKWRDDADRRRRPWWRKLWP